MAKVAAMREEKVHAHQRIRELDTRLTLLEDRAKTAENRLGGHDASLRVVQEWSGSVEYRLLPFWRRWWVRLKLWRQGRRASKAAPGPGTSAPVAGTPPARTA